MSLVAQRCWFRGADGALIHFDVREDGPRARGVVLYVHGLGEHLEKYAGFFDRAVERGWHVAAYDQRGHGRTPGRRGDYLFDDLVDDLGRFVAVTRDRYPELPIFLVAHSLGALVALAWAGRTEEPGVRGMALSSPPIALARDVSPWYRAGIRALARILPRLPVPRGSDPGRLTRDPDRRAALEADPLRHGTMTPRAMVSTEAAMEEVRAHPGAIRVPLLVLVAGDDRVASAPEAVAWSRRLEEPDVTVERIAGAYHEILNDLGREQAWDRILDWCDARA